jgi:starvation-inducible DNA-binding protein
MKWVHAVCSRAGDVATSSLLDDWIDEAETRSRFLFETLRR